MDKNQVTGLILISLLLLGYFYFSQDLQPLPENGNPQVTESPITQQETTTIPQESNTVRPAEAIPTDSLQRAQQKEQYGELAKVMSGESEDVVLENDQLMITFSSKGGLVKQVQLKEYQTFDKKPLILFDETNSTMSLMVYLEGQEVDLADLYFQEHHISNQGDSTELRFSIDLGNGKEDPSILCAREWAPDALQTGSYWYRHHRPNSFSQI